MFCQIELGIPESSSKIYHQQFFVVMNAMIFFIGHYRLYIHRNYRLFTTTKNMQLKLYNRSDQAGVLSFNFQRDFNLRTVIGNRLIY